MTRTIIFVTRAFIVAVLLISSTLLVAQNPVPFLDQPLAPDAIAPASAGVVVALTVNGSGFIPGSKLNWNGSTRATIFVSHSRLIAYIASSDFANPGTAWITVVNSAPGGGSSNTVFLPIHRPIPALSFHRTDYRVGSNPQFVATGDFNRDGKLDLVVANYGSGTVSVLLGNGDGTFRPEREYPASPCAQVPVVGDFNRDGILDLAVPGCGVVAVLLGRGDGTFGPPANYTISGATHGMTADFNGDGKLDLAISGSGVTVLLGNGDGTFQPSVTYPTDGFTTGVAIGDFDRDGKLDLAVSNYSGSVSVLLGRGDGTFQPQVEYFTGNSQNSVTTADLNGDGILDLAAGSTDYGTVTFLFGEGNGTFGQPVYYGDAGAGLISVGDFNADGKLDFAVLTLRPTIDIVLGSGNGRFQPPLSFVTGGHPWDVVPADFNGDGRLDFVNSNFVDGTVSVFLSQ